MFSVTCHAVSRVTDCETPAATCDYIFAQSQSYYVVVTSTSWLLVDLISLSTFIIKYRNLKYIFGIEYILSLASKAYLKYVLSTSNHVALDIYFILCTIK